MLSILIPTYNYNACPLVLELSLQCNIAAISYEIIVLDDCSTQSIIDNSNINNIEYCSYEKLEKNIGRVKARHYLAEKSKYNWLLFLDADVIPKNNNFITEYINHIKQNYDAIYGGFYYEKKKPATNNLLRWKYGKMKEQVSSSIRNKKPYKIVISANFVIKKPVFIKINSNLKSNHYGLDNYFGALLKQEKIKVLHLDNEVYHLGIEKSKTYLNKQERATQTILDLYQKNKIKEHSSDLLKLFSKLDKFRMTFILSFFYKLFYTKMTKNLTGINPSILILQLYKISFMCYSYHKKN